jgi:hypothetical protein
VKYEINKLDESFRRYEKVYAVYPADSEESSRRTFLMGMATHTLAEALAYYRLAEGAVKRRDQKLLSELWTTAGDRIREAERDLEESRKDLK